VCQFGFLIWKNKLHVVINFVSQYIKFYACMCPYGVCVCVCVFCVRVCVCVCVPFCAELPNRVSGGVVLFYAVCACMCFGVFVCVCVCVCLRSVAKHDFGGGVVICSHSM